MSPGRWTRRLALLARRIPRRRRGRSCPGRRLARLDRLQRDGVRAALPVLRRPVPREDAEGGQRRVRQARLRDTNVQGAAFTRGAYLNRTAIDWGTYVHSHGDHYWHAADGRRYSGFREDAGKCSQAVVYSKDIAAKRAGRQSNLVVMSMCHVGEDASTMPGAFAIAKKKYREGSWGGPEFFVGYLGDAWDNDEWQFEVAFWAAIGPGYGAGEAFDVAAAQVFAHPFTANWWGSYVYTGRAGPLPSGCDRCL